MRRILEFLAGCRPGLPVGRPALRALLLCVCCVCASVRLAAGQQCPDGSAPPCGRPTAAARAPTPAPNSVAVLPFANRSPDTADVYLAEGMTEEVSNQLARMGRLQVKAPSLAAAQWRRTPDALETGRRLGVAWVVEGYVRHAGTQLHVSASLLRVGSGEQAWGARFPRSAADVFAVQAEVAESVAVAVVGRLAPAERAVLARRPTENNEAYRLYLLGNSLLARRTELEVRNALGAYTEATHLDPTFAAAWARIAMARGIQSTWPGWEAAIPRDSLVAFSRVAAARALALDTLSAEAWLASGYAAQLQSNLWEAHSSYARSLRLDSLNADLWHFAGTMYSPGLSPLCVEEVAHATRLLRRALLLNPTLRNTWRHLAIVTRDAGRLADAEALLDTTLAFGPWPVALEDRAYVRFLRGNAAGALADLDEASRLDSADRRERRMMYALPLGDSAAARAVLTRLRALADSGRPVTSALAEWELALGHRAEALAALERLRATPNPKEPRCAPSTFCSASMDTWVALHDPIFAPLHGDPRFEALWDETRPRVPWLEGQGR